MTEITILLLLASIGATFIVTRSYLFENFRNLFIHDELLSTLVNCPQCFGFWCNLLFALFVMPLFGLTIYSGILYLIGTSFASSGICYVINEILEK